MQSIASSSFVFSAVSPSTAACGGTRDSASTGSSVSPLCRRLQQYKMSTPPWKDTFRKRCLQRLHNNREQLVNRLRGCDPAASNQQPFVHCVVRQEIQQLQQDELIRAEDVALYECIYEQMQTELATEEQRMLSELMWELEGHAADQSIIDEYEQQVQSQAQAPIPLSLSTSIIPFDCPLCGSTLTQHSSHTLITCHNHNCHFQLQTLEAVSEWCRATATHQMHNHSCTAQLQSKLLTQHTPHAHGLLQAVCAQCSFQHNICSLII